MLRASLGYTVKCHLKNKRNTEEGEEGEGEEGKGGRGRGRRRRTHMKPNTLCFWGEGQKRRKERNVEQSPLTLPDFVLFVFACFTVLTHLNNLTKAVE